MLVPGLTKVASMDLHLPIPVSNALETQPDIIARADHALKKRLASGATTGITIGSIAAGILIIIFGGLLIRKIQLRRRKEQLGRKPEVDFEIDGPISP